MRTPERHSRSWAFYQLRTFLEYKGIKEGVNVIAVPLLILLSLVINACTTEKFLNVEIVVINAMQTLMA
jgi:hypothetical protein